MARAIDSSYLLQHKRKVMFFGLGPDDERWGYAVPVEVIESAPTLTPPNEPRVINADKLAKRIAGHSNYHGDSILAAIYCAAEGKENDAPIRSIETPPNEWVSVEERLPKYNIREDGELISSKILCYCETDKTVHLVVSQKFYTRRKGEIVHPVFRYYDEWGDEIENVSHWMPLPTPPDRRPPEGERETDGYGKAD